MLPKTRVARVAGPTQATMKGGDGYSFPTVLRTIVRREDGSIGIKLRSRPNQNNAQTTVYGVEPNGPAERSGVRRGHVIVEVNGQSVLGWRHDKVVEVMRTGSLEVIRLRVCTEGNFQSPNKRRQPTTHRTPSGVDSSEKTPTAASLAAMASSASSAMAAMRPPSRRLEYEGNEAGAGPDFRASAFSDALAQAISSGRPAADPASSDAVTAETRTKGVTEIKLRSELRNLTDQVQGLLGIFKQLQHAGGLTNQGHVILDTLGLTKYLSTAEVPVPESPPSHPASVAPPAVTSTTARAPARVRSTATSKGAAAGTAPDLSSTLNRSQRLAAARIRNASEQQRRPSPNVSRRIIKTSSKGASDGKTPVGLRAVAMDTSPEKSKRPAVPLNRGTAPPRRTAMTSRVARKTSVVEAEPKWPIDGRSSNLPRKPKKGSTGDGELHIVALHYDLPERYVPNGNSTSGRAKKARALTNAGLASSAVADSSDVFLGDETSPELFHTFSREFTHITDEDFRVTTPSANTTNHVAMRSWM